MAEYSLGLNVGKGVALSSSVSDCTEGTSHQHILGPGPCCRSKSDTPSILVQNHMALNASNSVPFSWRIKDYLEDLCVQAQYITDAQGEVCYGAVNQSSLAGVLLPAPG